MKEDNALAVIFDLEYTAWEGSVTRAWSGDNEDPEIMWKLVGTLKTAPSDYQLTLNFRKIQNVNKNMSGVGQHVIGGGARNEVSTN